MSRVSSRPPVSCVAFSFHDVLYSIGIRRQQYRQQAQIIPHFVDMYQVCYRVLWIKPFKNDHPQKFISLEAEIGDALPKFQELLKYVSSFQSICLTTDGDL